MMDWTDRHDRFFLRLITRNAHLYTEMVTADAIRFGDRARLLDFDAAEHPLALQLGGSDPTMLAEAAKIGEDWGYHEINLNVGCPSVETGGASYGAALMNDPRHVRELAHAIADCGLPVWYVTCGRTLAPGDTLATEGLSAAAAAVALREGS